jgi:predicted esterase
VRVLSIETSTHGRVLIDDGDAAGSASGTLVVFHGYGQTVEEMAADVRRIPGAPRWRMVAVQALHRFYGRGAVERRGATGSPLIKDRGVVGSWMTRQDRELAIADNVAYVDKALDLAGVLPPAVFIGFSQGVAMAYRAATRGRHPAAGIIALAADIPPELKTTPGVVFPPVLIGAGTKDRIYPKAKLDSDVAFLQSHGVDHEVVRYQAGHVWTPAFRRAAARWLSELLGRFTAPAGASTPPPNQSRGQSTRRSSSTPRANDRRAR